MEKRLCLGFSSWIGGESGRSKESSGCRLHVSGAEDGLSWGGVTGGAGTEMVGGLPWAAASRSASRLNGEEGDRRRVGRSMFDLAVFKGGPLGESCRSSGKAADRRCAESPAMLARLVRRNGMVSKQPGSPWPRDELDIDSK